jgi:serine/threonine-protein kinase
MANLRDLCRADNRNADADNWEQQRKKTQWAQYQLEIKRHGDVLANAPLDAAALAGRALARARTGMFKEAADDYEQAIRLDPRDHWHWYHQGCLLAYLGDSSRYQQHCAAMLERYGDSKQNTIAERTAKACLLLSGGDVGKLSAMVDLAIASNDANFLPWFTMAKGMVEYRAGRFDQCIKHMTLAKSLSNPAAQVAAEAYIAMSQRRLGQDATASMARAQNLAARLGKPSVDDLADVGLENWLIATTAIEQARRAE